MCRCELIRGGPRNTAAALDALRTLVFSASNGDRPSHRNLAVIFLHAASMDEPATLRAASEARRHDITLLVVGVTENVKQRELEAIASYPPRTYVFRVPNYFSFVNIHAGLTRAACNRAYSALYRVPQKSEPLNSRFAHGGHF